MSYSTTIMLFLISTSQIIGIISIKTTGLFVITWLAGHCQYINNTCDPKILQSWDHSSFTINGLWPDYKSQERYNPFHIQYFTNTPLLEEMINFWPAQPKKGGKPYYLWDQSWKRHGHNYISLIKQTNSFMEKDQAQLQRKYFASSISLYKQLKVRNIPQNRFSLDQLSMYLGISTSSLQLICNDQGNLREIRICVNLQRNGFHPYACDKSRCSSAFLKDWKPKQYKQENFIHGKGAMSDSFQQQMRDKLKEVEIAEGQNIDPIFFDQMIDGIAGVICVIIALCWLPFFLCYARSLQKKNKTEASINVGKEQIVQQVVNAQLSQINNQKKQMNQFKEQLL